MPRSSHLRESELLQGRFICVAVQLRLGCERTGCGPAPPPLNEAEHDMSGLTVSTTVKWVITDGSTKGGKHLSETFSVGGHNW